MEKPETLWTGEEQLVIGIDVGTTNCTCSSIRRQRERADPPFPTRRCSGAASIVHLAPQQAPKVRIVARWPGEQAAASRSPCCTLTAVAGSPNSSKIPSLILYTPEGRPVAFGAEALQEKYQDDLFEERLHLARWFKVRLDDFGATEVS